MLAAKIPVAFAAGVLSVVTPCVLPLVPGYLSAISAVDPTRLGERGVARRVVKASLPFILGFTVVFVVLGAAAAAIGGIVNSDRQLEIAGFVLVVLGLVFMGLLPWPDRVVAPGLLTRTRHTGSSILLVAYSAGLGFAFLLAGIAFARAMSVFRWLRDHYLLIQRVSGTILVTLGLLLFFHRDWWLRVAMNRALHAVGLGGL